MKFRRSNHTILPNNDDLIIIGGSNEIDGNVLHCEIYNTKNQSVTDLSQLIIGRIKPGAFIKG